MPSHQRARSGDRGQRVAVYVCTGLGDARNENGQRSSRYGSQRYSGQLNTVHSDQVVGVCTYASALRGHFTQKAVRAEEAAARPHFGKPYLEPSINEAPSAAPSSCAFSWRFLFAHFPRDASKPASGSAVPSAAGYLTRQPAPGGGGKRQKSIVHTRSTLQRTSRRRIYACIRDSRFSRLAFTPSALSLPTSSRCGSASTIDSHCVHRLVNVRNHQAGRHRKRRRK